jgi:hypothetical protein
MRVALVAILFFFVSNQAMTQQIKQVAWSFALQPQRAFVYAHTPKLAQFKGSGGSGFQLDLNRLRLDSTAQSYMGLRFNSGFGIQFMHFDSSSLGSAINFSYFLEPLMLENQMFQLRLRAAGGLSIATKPFNEIDNKTNPAYSSFINGYLGLGMSVYYKLNASTWIFGNATYSHFSNGNTNNPNFGLNYPHLGIGLDHRIKETQRPIGKTLFQKEKWRFDLGIFGSNKSIPYYPKLRFWAYGAWVQAGYRTGAINAWTIAIEGIRDHSMRTSVDSNIFYLNKDVSINLIGALAGHEFVFNRCVFSQQLGMYLFNELPSELVGKFYHRWGFNYKLNKHFMVGLNLNANLQKAFLFDMRLIYCLYK